mgnify:CR=1 FL=1
MIPVLRVRDAGVRFDRILPSGFRILAALDRLATTLGRDVVLTCGTDSHVMPDPHVRGEAYDVSIKGWSATDIDTAHKELRSQLGPAFTVLYEVPSQPSDPTLRPIAYVNSKATGPHFHIQVKKGTTYP